MSTKKHFIAAAQTVAAIENETKRKEHAEILAAQFARENPRFDRARFFSACNVKPSNR
jgi:hypothetical protein